MDHFPRLYDLHVTLVSAEYCVDLIGKCNFSFSGFRISLIYGFTLILPAQMASREAGKETVVSYDI